MEKEKRRWANRLLAVCVCMTMVLIGIQVIPGADAALKARPPSYVKYMGGDVYVRGEGWNLITPLCDPRTPSNVPINAHYWCTNTLSIETKVPHDDWTTMMARINPVTLVSEYYYHSNHSGVNFDIQMGVCYWAYCRFDGWLPISSGSTGYSIVPKHFDMRLYGDNEAGWSGFNYVGPVWFCGGFSPPLDPPPPWEAYHYFASNFLVHIKNLDGTQYTGSYHLQIWNSSDPGNMHWELFDSDYGYENFVYASNYGVGNVHWGLCLYLTYPAYFHWQWDNP